MDELVVIDHLIAVGKEISDIRDANRVYWTRRTHNRLEQELHDKRRQRLKEIREDFPLWFDAPLPETSINL
jgi:hypothetical protein